MIEGEGYFTDLFLESNWLITFDSRSGVGALIQVCFGIIMVFIFDGSVVERWWKLAKRWNMTFIGCGSNIVMSG